MRFLPVACIIASACMYALTRPLVAHAYTLLSLSFSLYLYLPSTSNNNSKRERERERERRKERNSICANFLIEVSKKTLGFRETKQMFHLDRRKINTSSGRVLRAPNTFHDVLSRHRTHSRFSSPIPLSLSLSLPRCLFDEENIDGESSE